MRAKPGRWFLVVLLALVASLWLAARIEIEGSPPTERRQARWVQTVDGWEVAQWHDRGAADAAIHPAVVGAFIALASTLALLAIPPRNG